MVLEAYELDFSPPETAEPASEPAEPGSEPAAWLQLFDKVKPVGDQVKTLDAEFPGEQGSFVNKELVTDILRSSQRPELVYWVLRSYAEAWAEDPVIETDRGKTIYIDYDRNEENLSVYIGESSETICVSNNDSKKFFIMDVLERIDFLPYSSLGVVLKRQFSSAAILELDRRQKEKTDEDFPQPAFPTLIFTTGQNSGCSLCTDWILPSQSQNDLESDGNLKSYAESDLVEKKEQELLFEHTLHLGKKSSWVPGFESLNF